MYVMHTHTHTNTHTHTRYTHTHTHTHTHRERERERACWRMEKVRGTSTSRAGNALATSIASHPFSEMHRLRSALVGLHAIFTRRVCICPQFAAPTDNEDEGEGEVYHQPLGADAYVWLQVHVPHFIPLLSNPAVSGSLRKTVFDACSFGRARMETLISVQKDASQKML